MPSLAEAGHTVIAPDLRGFGLSDKPLEGFDVMTVAEDIRQVVQHLGLDEVSLAGHDAGASVAYHWAASHPDEVRRSPQGSNLRLGKPQPGRAKPHGILGSSVRLTSLKCCSQTANRHF
jgi:alpha-beta hydrolase superfamily lysophospholipase